MIDSFRADIKRKIADLEAARTMLFEAWGADSAAMGRKAVDFLYLEVLVPLDKIVAREEKK